MTDAYFECLSCGAATECEFGAIPYPLVCDACSCRCQGAQLLGDVPCECAELGGAV